MPPKLDRSGGVVAGVAEPLRSLELLDGAEAGTGAPVARESVPGLVYGQEERSRELMRPFCSYSTREVSTWNKVAYHDFLTLWKDADPGEVWQIGLTISHCRAINRSVAEVYEGASLRKTYSSEQILITRIGAQRVKHGPDSGKH